MMSTSGDLSAMRAYYGSPSLLEEDLAGAWHTQLAKWFAEAISKGLPEPNAMIVATASPDAKPSARTVLLKSFSEEGLIFFTNYASRKGRELAANPQCSLLLPWYPMHRQVVICGEAEKVSRADTEAYFAQRPRQSQLGAWASAQSTVLSGRKELEQAFAEVEAEFPGEIQAPPHWGGFLVRPQTVEFWQGRASRLHDRLVYERSGEQWSVERLAP
jgi:pyridoxamine 5'-phosphate oxidase